MKKASLRRVKERKLETATSRRKVSSMGNNGLNAWLVGRQQLPPANTNASDLNLIELTIF